MERIKCMTLKKSFFWITFWCLLTAVVVSILSFTGCIALRKQFAAAGTQIIMEVGAASPDEISFSQDVSGPETRLALAGVLELLQIGLPVLFILSALILSDILFYRFKLKTPLACLQEGAHHIMEGDLDFMVSPANTDPASTSAADTKDELSQLCLAFDAMRIQLKKNNQELWRQAEERKRLNAAFSHDLRNPITVLKGTVKLLKQNILDPHAIERLDTYTVRLEQYVETMSSIHRLEELPVCRKTLSLFSLYQELTETAHMLAPGLTQLLPLKENQTNALIQLDSGLFFNTAENLIGNAARFTNTSIIISLSFQERMLTLTVQDDGPGFPPQLVKDGPQPFKKWSDESDHFGMGLYICQMLCEKHGGALILENTCPGARITAQFSCTA